MDKIRVILVGAGNRGTTYTDIMSEMPEQFQVVAVAEPIESRRNHVRELHHIPDEYCFSDYEPLFALGKIADLAVIATMDRQHFAPAMKAIELKYDLLLEKPIAPSAEECVMIAKAAEENRVRVLVCTVLRYTRLFITLKEIIDSGRIGDVISINHEECVGNVHQSHSFVRGNWGNTERSSLMLLQKSCHDLDILQWLLGKKCRSIQSFGFLSYFTEENAPSDAPEYCIQGCPHGDNCPYNAVKLYLEDKENAWFRETCTRTYAPTDEDVIRAITETQYGKCVYKCDNDAVDHQTVNMLFEDNVTVTFSMNAFTKGGRFIHIMGTKGEIRTALANDAPIELYDFASKEKHEVPLTGSDGIISGHGGGDTGIIETLYQYLTGNYKGQSVPSISESCYNHLLVFAAEESRFSNTVVNVEEYIRKLPGTIELSFSI